MRVEDVTCTENSFAGKMEIRKMSGSCIGVLCLLIASLQALQGKIRKPIVNWRC